MLTNRWVSYAYEYQSTQRLENVGFIKVFVLGKKPSLKVRIQVGIKLYKNRVCKCEAFLFKQNIAKRIKEYVIKPGEKDAILSILELDYENPCGDDVEFMDYDGIFFSCDDGKKYISCWKDVDIDVNKLEVARYEKEVIEKEKCVECEEQKLYEEDSVRDYIESIFLDKTTIDNNGSVFNKAYKINLQDIGKLPVSNWGYARNSFLLHGYNTDGYIILGKVKELNRWMICIAGTYTNKNRYIARIYGFDNFISEESKDINTDSKGYWGSYIVLE